MIGIFKSKLKILFVVLILMGHTLSFPLQSFANNDKTRQLNSDVGSIKVGKVIANTNDEVPLYEKVEQIETEATEEEDISSEDSKSSNIIFYLKNNDIVSVIEEFDSYSFVEFVQETKNTEVVSDLNKTGLEESNVWQGYIANKYLEIELDNDSTNNDSNQNEQNNNDLDSEDDRYLEDDTQNNQEDTISEEQNELDEELVSEEENSSNLDSMDDSYLEDDVESNQDGIVSEEQNKLDEGLASEEDSAENELDSDSEKEISEDNKNKEINTPKTFSLQQFSTSSFNQRGVAQKSKTYIRTKPSTKANSLKVVPAGTVLDIRLYPKNENWYEVSIGNKVGYIHKKHFETTVDNQITIRGVALKSPTNIRERASTKSKVIKSIPIGSILQYKTFSTHWYEIALDGNRLGYIHKKHVGDAVSTQDNFRGITLKSPTNIRTTPSTKSKVLTSYPIGSVISYKTFNNHWYEVDVVIGGVKRTGFVHKKHVENSVSKQETKYGLALKSPTNVRVKASTKSNVIYTFPVDSIVEYKTFSTYWNEVTIKINGQKKTGYIHKNHLGKTDSKIFRGVTLREPTAIRKEPSTGSKSLITYPKGTILEYRFHNESWSKVNVIVNGKKQTGYISDNDIDNVKNKIYRGVALNPTTYIRTKPSTKANPLTTVPIGTIIKYHLYNEHWYEAIMTVNGKERTGFIHKKHIEEAETNQKMIDGYALRSPTNVRAYASTKAKVIVSFPEGAKVRYKTFSTYWHEITVTVNGVQKTGYIHRNHVGTKAEYHKRTNYGYDFKYMVDKQMAGTPKADGSGKVNATKGQVEFYTNPSNFLKGTPEYFQFLVLSQPAGLDAVEVNEKLLKGKGVLDGMGQAFIDAGKKYNINEAYLISHALHETGNGNSILASGVPVDKNGSVTRNSKGEIAKTSKTAKIVYNMYGYGAKDSCPIECGAKYAFDHEWFSLPTAIVGGAGNIVNYINRGQDTLYKMRWNPDSPGYPQYATHVQWAVLQTRNIYNIYNSLNSYNAVFDVPTFNHLPNYNNDAYGSTTADKLNFRNGPGTIYHSLGKIPKGSKVQIIGSNPNGWYKVKYKAKTGWVSAQYVSLKY